MFGEGIYTTQTSSKADDYVLNHRIRSQKHVMILCLVYVGRSQTLYQADHNRTSAGAGYHSITAATTANGGAVRYDETVVYEDCSIVPIGLIVYTRTGWTTS